MRLKVLFFVTALGYVKKLAKYSHVQIFYNSNISISVSVEYELNYPTDTFIETLKNA
jgi:hypothetical protein